VVEMSEADFEAAVAAGLDAVPPDLTALMRNVVVLVEPEPPPHEPADTLGLYVGVPLTHRDDWGGGNLTLPDRIMIFRGPTLRACQSVEQVEREVRITVVHEIAHHFGIDDERLHELGWG
jgi:predicted Zn-dependent protease with MMP-like domain